MDTFPRCPATRKSYPSLGSGEGCSAEYAIRLLKTDLRNPPVENPSRLIRQQFARTIPFAFVVPGSCVVMALPAPYEGLGGYGKRGEAVIRLR